MFYGSASKNSICSSGRWPRPEAGSKMKNVELQEHATPLHRKDTSGVDKTANQDKAAKNNEANKRKGRRGGQGTGQKDEGGEEDEI